MRRGAGGILVGAVGALALGVGIAVGADVASDSDGNDASGGFGTVTTVQMPPGFTVREAATGDVNGDGLADLVLCVRTGPQPFARGLRVYFRRAEGLPYRTEADAALDLVSTPDAVAYAIGDVHPDPGDEILLFSMRGAYAWRPRAPREERFFKIAPIRFLWQVPHPRELFAWNDGVRDVDADGLDDVIVPEPDGYRILFQDRKEGVASFERVAFLALPREPEDGSIATMSRTGTSSVRVNVQFGSAEERGIEGPFLSIFDRVPVPKFLDWDADGDLDVLAQNTSSLLVWPQGAGGKFERDPRLRYPLPLEVDRKRLLDISYSAHVADLDRDGRADYVLLAGDQRGEGQDRRTQVLVFVQGAGRDRTRQTPDAPLFGPEGLPQQLLVIAGFAGAPWFGDVDGDGDPDFVVGSIRFDLIDQLRVASTETLDTELYVYRNEKGRFSARPDLEREVTLRVDEIGELGDTILARFVGDVTGDGVSELLLRDRPGRMRLHPVFLRRGKLEVGEAPLFELKIEEDARCELLEGDGKRRPEILILEEAQILHVKFP